MFPDLQEPSHARPRPADVEVFVGVDVAKGDHYACAATADDTEALARSVRNDEAAISQLIDDAAACGAVALVIDTTSSAAALLLEAAARREVPVAYVSGLVMRRAADLYGRSATTRKPRGGNHRLKNALFTAAFVAAKHDPEARAYYQRKRSEGKRHDAAVICVARRRCNIILAMLKTQTPYQPPQPLPQAA